MSLPSWLHCNKCYRDAAEVKRALFIGKCGHISCIECAKNESSGKSCAICKITGGIVELTKVPAHVAMPYFGEPYQFSAMKMEVLKRMLTFQKKTQDRFELAHIHNYKKAQEENRILRERVNQLRKKTQSLDLRSNGQSRTSSNTLKDDFFAFTKASFGNPHDARHKVLRIPGRDPSPAINIEHTLERRAKKVKHGTFF